MQRNNWQQLKTQTEKQFESIGLEKCWGFQIQKNTKWNKGLTENEITNLEKSFGFKFPIDYFEMLKALNGFDTPHLSIDPEGKEDSIYERRCYQYPEDLEKTKWLIAEVNANINYANEALEKAGFDSTQVEGFIPLYEHRALVVFKNKELSPVLSIWDSDIIISGETLMNYWRHEFRVEML